MFRKKLDKNHGMLFIFEKADIYSFWMKNMHIPLDIIWLDKNYKIIYIKENAKPCNEQNCQSYKPDLPAKYIIEINSNFTKKNNIKIGDRIKIPRYHIDNEE